MRYLEDLNVGDRYALSGWSVTRAEIQEFAKRWDPQPFHIDEMAAEASIFGGIVASGLHTMGVALRLANRDFFSDTEALGGLGMNDVRIPEPVRPGDTLTGHLEITRKRRSRSDDSRGIVRINYMLVTTEGKHVLDMSTDVIILSREPPG
jgi:acyl dehydratase